VTPDKNHGLTLDEVIPRLRANHEAMQPSRELEGIDPDTAFSLGYETAIHDLVRYTGPDPLETGIITYTKTGVTDDNDD